MSDYLLELSRHPLAKKLLRQIGLPLPLPEILPRAKAHWQERELAGKLIAIGGTRQSTLRPVLSGIIANAGGELAEGLSSTNHINAIVFDGRSMEATLDLGSLYDFIKPRLSSLLPASRVLLLGQEPSAAATPELAANAAALVGFGKSLAKELGRRGSTCQILFVKDAAANAAALDTPLRFFLSNRSAFISGQCMTIGAAPFSDPAPTEQPLAGKTALVTGAAQGIGAAICRGLAAEGARIIGHDRIQEKAALSLLMQELGGIDIYADLLDPSAVQRIIEQVETATGYIDILVNNAGITRDKTLLRMPRDWWDSTLLVDLTVPIHLSEAFLRGNAAGKPLISESGRILFLSSVAGLAGNAGQTNYAAAKAGLAGYVHAMAARGAGREITVNAIAPGFIETRMTAAMPVAIREVARRFNALNQGGVPEDVAEAAVFLSLPGSAGINGSVLRVCGQNFIGA